MAKNLHQFIHDVGKLKRKARAGWVKHNVDQPESVAEHSFRMGIMAYTLAPKFGLNPDKVLKMSLFHDLSEYKIPDYTPLDNVTKEAKYKETREAMKELCSQIENGDEIFSLWNEFEERKTPEAKFVKALDRLEMMFQAEEYAQEQPDKDLELFWEMSQGFDWDVLEEIFELLKTNRTKTPRLSK